MDLNTRHIHKILENAWLTFLGSVASIVALVWLAYSELHPSPWTILGMIFAPIGFLVFLATAIYSIRVRQQNIQFKNFVAVLHRVNHDYRDALSAVFKHSSNFHSASHLDYVKQIERQVLKSTCQKIAKVYEAFEHCPCTATIKLIREDDIVFCETYERSEEISPRDACQPRKFKINTGENTAFDTALMYNQGRISHFHSFDLTKEKDYQNQRTRYAEFYKCAIVVPIRSLNPSKIGLKEGHDDIGFLCVDTLSPNRLNNTWHVELLASFADQMYNFISLMRGRYSLGAAMMPEK